MPGYHQLLTELPPIKQRSGGAGVLRMLPNHGAFVMEYIANWARAEVSLGQVLASCLHADSSAPVQMYLSLLTSGIETRKKLLLAAANHSGLSSDDVQLFKDVLSAIDGVRRLRNDFAHGMWSTSPELADVLLWDPPDPEIVIWEFNVKGEPPIDSPYGKATRAYSRSALAREVEEARDAAGVVFRLAVLFSPRQQAQHDYVRQIILERPIMANTRSAKRFAAQSKQPKPDADPHTATP